MKESYEKGLANRSALDPRILSAWRCTKRLMALLPTTVESLVRKNHQSTGATLPFIRLVAAERSEAALGR